MPKKYIDKKIPLFCCYSLFLGFIAMLISRYFYAKTNNLSIPSVALFDTFRMTLGVIVAIVLFTVLYVFALQKGKNRLGESRFYAKAENILYSPLTFSLLAVLSFRIWYYGNFQLCAVWYDSPTYVNYPENLLLGQVDEFRTPIFPWIIKLVRLALPSDADIQIIGNGVARVQIMVSFLTVILFYFTAKKIIKNKYICAAATVVFGISPYIFLWDLTLLTESFSISATVLALYLIMNYIEKPSTAKAVILGLYVIIMIMLRPTFIYMFAILGVFFIARMIFVRGELKQALCGILALAVSGSLLLGYCALNKKQHDCFSVSTVSTSINRLYMVIENGIYKNAEYPEISDYIDDKLIESAGDINYVVDIIEPLNEKFKYSEVSDYVNDCIKNNKETFNDYTIRKFKSCMLWKMPTQYASYDQSISEKFVSFNKNWVYYTFPFDFFFCFALVVAVVAAAVIMLIISKRIFWQPIGLSAVIFTHLFVSIYGSMAEYSRLSAMVAPAVYLLLFMIADIIVCCIINRKSGAKEELFSRGEKISLGLARKSKSDLPAEEPDNNSYNDDIFV